MDPLDIFLDTEVLRRDPYRRSGPFRALSVLATMGIVQVHVSQVSIMEFITHIEAETRTACATATTALGQLQRWCRHRPDAMQQPREICTASATGAIEATRDSLEEWVDNLGVRVVPIASDHAGKVFTAYFAGQPPFKQAKNRADIPDAFIWQAVLDCCKAGTSCIFVSGDGGFLSAAGSGPANLKHYPTLKEVVETSPFAETLRKGLLESQIDLASQLFPRIAEVHHNFKVLLTRELVGRRIFFFYPVETDYEIRTVEEVGGVLSEGRAQYYGDGLLSFPFSARVVCKLSTVVSRERAAAITQVEGSSLSEPTEEGAELSVTRTLILQGALLTEIGKEVLGSHVEPEEMLAQLLAGESAIDDLVVNHETGRGGKLARDAFERHAFDEAQEQIDAGNLDTDLDTAEERDRLARARWFPIPKHLQGNQGEFIIGEDARFRSRRCLGLRIGSD